MEYTQSSSCRLIKKDHQEEVYDSVVQQQYKIQTEDEREVLPFYIRKLGLFALCEAMNCLKLNFEHSEVMYRDGESDGGSEGRSRGFLPSSSSKSVRGKELRWIKAIWKPFHNIFREALQRVKEEASMDEESSSEVENLESYMKMLELSKHMESVETNLNRVVSSYRGRSLLQGFINIKEHWKRSAELDRYHERCSVISFVDICQSVLERFNRQLVAEEWTSIVCRLQRWFGEQEREDCKHAKSRADSDYQSHGQASRSKQESENHRTNKIQRQTERHLSGRNQGNRFWEGSGGEANPNRGMGGSQTQKKDQTLNGNRERNGVMIADFECEEEDTGSLEEHINGLRTHRNRNSKLSEKYQEREQLVDLEYLNSAHLHEVGKGVTANLNTYNSSVAKYEVRENRSGEESQETFSGESQSGREIMQQVYVVRSVPSNSKRRPDHYFKVPLISENVDIKFIQTELHEKSAEFERTFRHSSSFYDRNQCENCPYCLRMAAVKKSLSRFPNKTADSEIKRELISTVQSHQSVIETSKRFLNNSDHALSSSKPTREGGKLQRQAQPADGKQRRVGKDSADFDTLNGSDRKFKNRAGSKTKVPHYERTNPQNRH